MTQFREFEVKYTFKCVLSCVKNSDLIVERPMLIYTRVITFIYLSKDSYNLIKKFITTDYEEDF